MEPDDNDQYLDTLPAIPSYSPPKPKPPGRGKGSKNKVTLLREAVLQGQENVILRELPKIVKVVCEKAAEGDLTAAKLILDRIIPVRKAGEEGEGAKGPPTINIVIEGTTTKVQVSTPKPVIEEADFEEIEEENPNE